MGKVHAWASTIKGTYSSNLEYSNEQKKEIYETSVSQLISGPI